MNRSLPRTPFSTPLSGSARETENRLRNIFSGPKKRPPVLTIVLAAALCLLCGNLVSCQVAQAEIPDPRPTPLAVRQAGAAQLLDHVQGYLFRTRTVSLGEWRDKVLSLELKEHRVDQLTCYQVDRVNVCLDGEPIQVITAPEMLPNGVEPLPGGANDPYQADWSDWSCEGLFDTSPDYEHGTPIVLDLNFDGCMDFGLMDGPTASRNNPYVFYLWDPEREQFDCFGTFNNTLEANPEAQQLAEVVYGGNEGDDTNWYAWEDGKLVLVRREEEDWQYTSTPQMVKLDGRFYETYPIHIYVREDGRMVRKEDEIRYFPAG